MHDIEKFVSGFSRFQQQYFNHDESPYGSLRAGQRLRTLLIGCCDSRVDPVLLTPRPAQRETDFVGQWMRIAEPVAQRVRRDLAHPAMTSS